ncbi:MAG: hypothetical protein JWO05_26 [Gemmatimonadetes bacterium]|nr:hypothetical protein [Gemmatimonadota bacterium]
MSRAPRFASVVIDVDSTLSGIEGIDWLARRRGPEVAERVAQLTDLAMRGEVALDSVYGERMAAVSPTRKDIDALASEYRAEMAAGAGDAVRAMRAAGVKVTLVSGGLRPAILPLCRSLGLPDAALHAVEVRFGEGGVYAGYDTASPLTTQSGKAGVVESLQLAGPVLAVGDGATDLAMRSKVDAFAVYTGFVQRGEVIAKADHVVASFAALRELLLS